MGGRTLLWLLPALLLGGYLAWPEPAAPLADGAAAFAPSLRQTVPDGAVRVDNGGRLLGDAALKARFDYYLSTLGERDLPAVTRAVEAELAQQLSGNALAQARALFRRYLAYLAALRPLEQRLGAGQQLADIEARLAAVHDLRRQHFSATEIDAFFGGDARFDQVALARRQVLQDGRLSAVQRQQRLAELERQLPAATQQIRSQAVQHLTLAAQEQALRQQGGDARQLQALRTEQVGEAAAQRLAALDAEQAAWQARIADWQRQRQQLQADATLSPLQRQQAQLALQQRLFSSAEQARLLAYGG